MPKKPLIVVSFIPVPGPFRVLKRRRAGLPTLYLPFSPSRQSRGSERVRVLALLSVRYHHRAVAGVRYHESQGARSEKSPNLEKLESSCCQDGAERVGASRIGVLRAYLADGFAKRRAGRGPASRRIPAARSSTLELAARVRIKAAACSLSKPAKVPEKQTAVFRAHVVHASSIAIIVDTLAGLSRVNPINNRPTSADGAFPPRARS